MPARVSVALCTRDGRRFIETQLESILTQSLPPDEVVVSDDASTDGTVDAVRSTHERIAPRLPLHILENARPLGVTANFAQALTASSGDLIALSDQDDRWHPDRLARAVELLRAPETLAVGTDARLVDRDGHPLGRTLFGDLEVSASDLAAIGSGDALPRLLRRNLFTGATMTVRRELVERALPFPPEWVHDEWLALIAAATGRVALATETRIDYRQHDSNEIGVRRPTLRGKVARVLASEGARRTALAARWGVLAERLPSLPGVSEEDVASARGKAAFEGARAGLPRSRARRIPTVLRLAPDYPRFASQGRLDMVRDVLSAP